MTKTSKYSNYFVKKMLFIPILVIIYFLINQSICFAGRITKGYISAEKNIAGNVTVNIKPVKKGDKLLVYRNGDLIAGVSIDLVLGNLVVAKVIKEEDLISKGDVCFLKNDAFSNYLDVTKKLKEKIKFFIDNKSYAKAISHYNQLIKSDIDILPVERLIQERDLLRMLELLNSIQVEYSQKCYKKAISLFNEFPDEYLAPLVKNNIVVGNIKASEITKRFYSTRKLIEDISKRIKAGELVFFNGEHISRKEKEKLEEDEKEEIKIAIENEKRAQELELLEKTSSAIDKNKFTANLQEYMKSIVTIFVADKYDEKGYQGSGFFVGCRGEIITCYHVIKDYAMYSYGKTIFVKQKNNFYTAKIIYGDSDHDFAIIKLDKKCKIIRGNEGYYHPVNIPNYELKRLQPLTIGNSDVLSIAEKVYTIGAPHGFEETVMDGVVSQIRQVEYINWIQITNPIAQGSSGSPLINETGEVVGIVFAKTMFEDTSGINWAMPINYIKKYLEKENINYRTKASFGGYKNSLKIGINYLSKGQNQKAIEVFNQFIFQNSSISATYYFLGKAYESIDKSKAVGNYKKYLQKTKYSDGTSKYINYAKTYIKSNELQQVIKSDVAEKSKKAMATIENNILGKKTKQISDRNKVVFYFKIAIIFLITIGLIFLIFQPWNKRKNEQKNWYTKKIDGTIYGPVDTKTLRIWIQEKRVLASDYIRIKEVSEWSIASSIHLFGDLFGNIPSEISALSNSSKYFFPTSKTKLVVMSLCTLGIYKLYWFYENWQFVKEKEKIDISPFWRAWFSIFYCYRFFKIVREYANQNSVKCRFRPGLLAFGYILCIISVKLPGYYWLIAELGFLFLLPIQGTINELQIKLGQKAEINRRFSWWNIFGIIVGIIWWTLIFLGMTE